MRELAALSGRPAADLVPDFRPLAPDGFDSLAVSELVVYLLDEFGLDLMDPRAFARASTWTLAELHDAALSASSQK